MCGSRDLNPAGLWTHPGAQMCFAFLPMLRRHFAVELLPSVRGTLKMQAGDTVGPIKTCAEEKLEWIGGYLGGT